MAGEGSKFGFKAETLRTLHKGPRLLVLANVWDCASARIVAKAGFPALATSSAAVAAVRGYPDGQRISRDEMIEMVGWIARSVPLPVSADVEAGYGDTTDAAAQTARAVLAAGAVGINLEDAGSDGRLFPLEAQVARIRAARSAAPPLVINARTDVFGVEDVPAPERMPEAIRRANAYLAAGADCAFVPWVVDPERFKDILVPTMPALIGRVTRYRRAPLLTPEILVLDEMGKSAPNSAVAADAKP